MGSGSVVRFMSVYIPVARESCTYTIWLFFFMWALASPICFHSNGRDDVDGTTENVTSLWRLTVHFSSPNTNLYSVCVAFARVVRPHTYAFVSINSVCFRRRCVFFSSPYHWLFIFALSSVFYLAFSIWVFSMCYFSILFHPREMTFFLSFPFLCAELMPFCV